MSTRNKPAWDCILPQCMCAHTNAHVQGVKAWVQARPPSHMSNDTCRSAHMSPQPPLPYLQPSPTRTGLTSPRGMRHVDSDSTTAVASGAPNAPGAAMQLPSRIVAHPLAHTTGRADGARWRSSASSSKRRMRDVTCHDDKGALKNTHPHARENDEGHTALDLESSCHNTTTNIGASRPSAAGNPVTHLSPKYLKEKTQCYEQGSCILSPTPPSETSSQPGDETLRR